MSGFFYRIPLYHMYYLACLNKPTLNTGVIVLSTRQETNVPMIVDFDGKKLKISCIDKILGNINDNLNFEYGPGTVSYGCTATFRGDFYILVVLLQLVFFKINN